MVGDQGDAGEGLLSGAGRAMRGSTLPTPSSRL